MALSHRRKLSLVLSVAVPAALVASTVGTAGAAGRGGPQGISSHRTVTSTLDDGDKGDGETQELLDRSAQYAAVRTAPAATVSSEAFRAAAAQAAALPLAAGAWKEVTNQPYNSDADRYRDPFWSNSGGGSGLVSGRMTALTTDGDTVYAGAADGGVWMSTDQGKNWKPIFDSQTRLSIGAIAVNPADHSLWVGTGEANSNADAFNGDGIYRSPDQGKTWQLVGNRVDNSLVSRMVFDGNGYVYAATSQGLLKRSTLDMTAPWTVVLKPDPNPTHSPYRGSWISDVQIRPGTGGRNVTAVLGWRGGTLPTDLAYNGFYVSHTGGDAGSFDRVDAHGIPGMVGRTSLDYAADGALLAIVEDPTTLGLKGVYRSASGFGTGPWTLLADNAKLAKAPNEATGNPGAQAWYDQYVTADPQDPKHFYVGLTEVFETSDGGKTFTTIGPYWNFPFACYSPDPAKDTCPNTTHADQHAAYVAPNGFAYFANDGGVYGRPTSLRTQVHWRDLNATLHTLQYYYAGIGAVPGGDAIWGGLQDNGTSLLKPGLPTMVSPFGGDGTDVIVDPKNGDRAVNSYVYMTMARTQNGGESRGDTRSYTTITPTCASLIGIEFDPKPCDPNPRFIAPFEADPKNIDHWVAGGQFVWDNQGKGWDTVCTSTTCDWKKQHDLGAGAQTTAITASGATTYVGWCGNGCNPGGAAPFTSGIDTNYGGSWHRVTSPVLPDRMPTSFAVDPTNAAHVYVTYGAFSRRWIPSAGVGHLFESFDGGQHWADASGNLPDAPATDVVLKGGKVIVSTDVGVFVAGRNSTGSWSRLGTGLPGASTNDLVLSPDNSYLVAATHGRGMWKFDLGSASTS